MHQEFSIRTIIINSSYNIVKICNSSIKMSHNDVYSRAEFIFVNTLFKRKLYIYKQLNYNYDYIYDITV